ncbi:hypothetical protein Tco_1368059 [Tanacetum coccineum]
MKKMMVKMMRTVADMIKDVNCDLNLQTAPNDWQSIIQLMIKKLCVSSISGVLGRIGIAACVHHIWKERNFRIFQNVKNSEEEIKKFKGVLVFLVSDTLVEFFDLKEVDHVSESNDEQPIDDFEILQTKLNNMDEQAFDNELGTEGDKKDGENRYSIDSPKKKMEEDTNFNSTNSETKDNSSDLSRPPGFEFMKKSFSSSSNCSTSFARRRKNDIKGFSLLSELNQIIDVGSSLGYDVRGCKKTLNKMIKGIGIHMVDK